MDRLHDWNLRQLLPALFQAPMICLLPGWWLSRCYDHALLLKKHW